MKKTLFLFALTVAVLIVPTSIEAKTFSDISGHWAEEQIYKLVGEGVVDGFPDGTFRPDEPVQVDQFLKMLLMAVSEDREDRDIRLYKDLMHNPKVEIIEFKLSTVHHRFDFKQADGSYWAKPFIDEAIYIGAIRNFYLDEAYEGSYQTYLTRQNVATIADNMLFLIEGHIDASYMQTAEPLIRDYQHVKYTDEVRRTFITGIIQGYPDGNFRPLGLVTRAESLVILDRIINKEKRLPHKADMSQYHWLELPAYETGDTMIKVFPDERAKRAVELIYDNVDKTKGAYMYREKKLYFLDSEKTKQEEIERYKNVSTMFSTPNLSDWIIGSSAYYGSIEMWVNPKDGSIERHREAMTPFLHYWLDGQVDEFIELLTQKRAELQANRHLQSTEYKFGEVQVRIGSSINSNSESHMMVSMHR